MGRLLATRRIIGSRQAGAEAALRYGQTSELEMATSFFHDMLGSIAERGRALIERSATRSTTDRSGRTAQKAKSPEDLKALCRDLLSGRGEASGVALARQILDLYASLSVEKRLDFFRLLAHDFAPDQKQLRCAWASYDQAPNPGSLHTLLRAVEPPRQELFRRLNLAPGGPRALVGMREDLIEHGYSDPDLVSVEDDLGRLLILEGWSHDQAHTPVFS